MDYPLFLNSMKKIVLIADAIFDPLIVRRVEDLCEAGFEVHLYGYKRNTIGEHKYNSDIKIKELGSLNNGGKYFKKFLKIKKDIKKIIKREGKEDILYYGFGFIIGNILSFHRVNYIYEICDLLYGYGIMQKIALLFKTLDRRAIKKSKITVLTSHGFHKYLFRRPQSNIIIQPNRINKIFLEKERPHEFLPNISHLRFAYVGAPRSKATVLHFAKIIGKFYPNHEFHFYGDGPAAKGFEAETMDYKNVFFHGRFRNPDDLSEIYKNIDLVVACYETDALNERILEPNKLYEAIYFKKPIVVSKNSFLAERVSELNCGYTINAYSESQIRYFVDSLNDKDMESIQKSDSEIAKEYTIDSSCKLIKKLLQLYNN